MSSKTLMLLFMACLGLASCSQQDNKAVVTTVTTPKRPELPEPFKFHKVIEVSPGQYFDILSWGRGAKGGGEYMILRSDSSDQKYTSTDGDLEGPVQDVLNSDLDTDGNPEIIIQANTVDTNRYTNVFVYEYHDDRPQKLDWPRMTVSQRKGYRGGDRFYIKDDKLMREFPLYDGSGSAAKLNGKKRLLEYSMHSNEFSVKQVSKDSTDNKTTEQDGVVAKPVQVSKKTTTTSSSVKRSSSKKKSTHKSETKRKKRRHRR